MAFQSFKQFIKGGKFLGLKEIGDSIVVKLACDPFELEPKESKFKPGVQVFDYIFEDPETGEKKILTNGNARFGQEISKFEEGDLVKIMLIEAKNGQKSYAARPAKGKVKDEDDEDEDEDEEDDEPKKKKASDDEDEEEDDEDDEPKKKKKSSDDDEDEDDEEEIDLDDEDDEDDKPKKKKKSDDDDEEDDNEDEEEEKPKKKKKKSKK